MIAFQRFHEPRTFPANQRQAVSVAPHDVDNPGTCEIVQQQIFAFVPHVNAQEIIFCDAGTCHALLHVLYDVALFARALVFIVVLQECIADAEHQLPRGPWRKRFFHNVFPVTGIRTKPA